MVVMPWFMESHRGIPATSRIKMERIVNRKYIHHIILTVVMMRGNIFSSRPSARYRWYILVPGRVMMLIINTTTPTPPIHWVSDLQNWMVWVSCDGAVIIVSPVPVHPEVDSNTEFKGDMPSIRINGMLPHEVVVVQKFGDKVLSDDEMGAQLNEAAIISFLWVLFLFMGIFVMLHIASPSYYVDDVIFEVVSAQSNVGLSTGITSPDMMWVGKLMLIFNMWVGRLEIIPIIVTFKLLLRRFG